MRPRGLLAILDELGGGTEEGVRPTHFSPQARRRRGLGPEPRPLATSTAERGLQGHTPTAPNFPIAGPIDHDLPRPCPPSQEPYVASSSNSYVCAASTGSIPAEPITVTSLAWRSCHGTDGIDHNHRSGCKCCTEYIHMLNLRGIKRLEGRSSADAAEIVNPFPQGGAKRRLPL